MTSAQEQHSSRANARIGSVLRGKYRLDRVLGVGGMAAVYAATHLRNANRVAIKLLHTEHARDDSLRVRFLREGYAANSVGHPGTVRVLDDETADDGAVFLVMELLRGETLEARWKRRSRRLPVREVAHHVYRVLDVLGAAHRQGIVHRDIKPENLFLTSSGDLKVLDFGVAVELQRSGTTTRPGGLVGTPSFMAPEQVLGKTGEVDAQSDLWSVGATAFTMISGRTVHAAETAEEEMVYAASRPAPSLASAAPDVPPPLVAVVDRALALAKPERWPSALAMRMALAEAFGEVFGEPLRSSLEALEDDADDKTIVMSAPALPIDPEDVIASEPLVPQRIEVLAPAADTAPSLPRDDEPPESAPPSTTDGIARSEQAPVSSTTTVPPRPRIARLVGAATLGAAVAAAGAVLWLGGPKRATRPAVEVRTPAVAAAARVVDPPAEAVAPSAAAPSPVESVEPPSVPVEALPSSRPFVRAARPKPAHAAAPSAASSSTAAPSATALDQDGI